jgi:hypothetical protein
MPESPDFSVRLRAVIVALEETETMLRTGATVPPYALAAAAQLRYTADDLTRLAQAVYRQATGKAEAPDA